MSVKILPPKDLVIDILNDNTGCEQRLLDFYGAYIKAAACAIIDSDTDDCYENYVEDLESEIKYRIIAKLPVLRKAVRDKLDAETLYIFY